MKDFSTSEVELMDAVDTLQRAISILQKKMAKNPASLQKKINTRNLTSVVEAPTVVIDAAAFSSVDRQKLEALLQSRQANVGGVCAEPTSKRNPVAATCQSHSSGFIDVFNDWLAKAQTTLSVPSPLRRCSSSLLSMSWHRATSPWRRENGQCGVCHFVGRRRKPILRRLRRVWPPWRRHRPQARAVVFVWPLITSIPWQMQRRFSKNETGTAEGQTHSLFQESSVASLHTTSDFRGFEAATMARKLTKKEHSAALAQFASRISVP